MSHIEPKGKKMNRQLFKEIWSVQSLKAFIPLTPCWMNPFEYHVGQPLNYHLGQPVVMAAPVSKGVKRKQKPEKNKEQDFSIGKNKAYLTLYLI